ncbi:MAG: FKBP-type peptidyl-prolyl cis-trans isomerase [Steroidobacteraceae bacterium]|jgi:FKBP-type peptidyl-prolyl cis-trans isomerase
MTLPVPRRGRILLTGVVAAAALCAASMPGVAQQPSPTTPPPAKSGAHAPAKSGDTKEKGPNPCVATTGAGMEAPVSAECSRAASHSIGVLWGSQLRSTGVPPSSVEIAQITLGIRQALTGKITIADDDRENIRVLLASGVQANHHAAEKFLADNGKKPGVVTTASGLQYQELKAGSGASPKATDTVVVTYRGTLLDGTEFDASSKHGGQPATFEVDRVIPGWTEALQLMKPGAKWKVFVPPRLAYDLRPPTPAIPPGALLLFDVELLSVKPASAPQPASPAPAAPIPQSALPKSTGKPPVNAPESPNSPPPASIAPASK